MSNKALDSIIGFAIGLVIDVGVVFLAVLGDICVGTLFCEDGYNCMSKSVFSFGGICFFVIIVIVATLIGSIIGRDADKEAQRKLEKEQQLALARAEQERQEALAEVERKRQGVLNRVSKLLDYIAKSDLLGYGEYDSIYNEVWRIKSEIASFGDSYLVQFNNLLQEHTQSLNDAIKNYLEKLVNVVSNPHLDLRYILHHLMLLKYANGNDCGYDSTIHTLKEFVELLNRPMYFLESNEYGHFTLILDNPEEMIDMNENAFSLEDKLTYMLGIVLDCSDGYYHNMNECLTEEFLKSAGRLMWYYAKKMPFNVKKFEESRSLYNKYTSVTFVPEKYAKYHPEEHTFTIGKVEEILAVLYSKNQIGGKGTVQQEKEYIDAWLEMKISNKKVKECSLFVSGMAWLELYELELEALHKMVQGNIQLSAELQERLHFLEVGGTSNVKVYEISPASDFVYDSSSENWNANEFNVFFRKVGMKKLNLNYSLSISTWKKTLPLSGGQKASMNDLYREFQSMIEDFDGEVSCTRTRAKAIDLENVVYPDAVIFRFTSERNKCLSMLFSCEKFGRNLNLTIITLFTPDNDMDVESMQKYATAIKSNIYVDSFRETILQEIDEVIKEEKKIYDEEERSSSNKKFVE